MLETLDYLVREIGERMDTIIAVCALVLAVQQGITSRRHERASFRPYLTFERVMKLDEDHVELMINNHGPGSALIETFEVSLDGAKVQPTLSLWHDLMGKLRLPFIRGGGTVLSIGDAIPPHASSVIARFTSKTRGLAGIGAKVTEELLRVRVVVKYKSAFGEVQTMDSSKFVP